MSSYSQNHVSRIKGMFPVCSSNSLWIWHGLLQSSLRSCLKLYSQMCAVQHSALLSNHSIFLSNVFSRCLGPVMCPLSCPPCAHFCSFPLSYNLLTSWLQVILFWHYGWDSYQTSTRIVWRYLLPMGFTETRAKCKFHRLMHTWFHPGPDYFALGIKFLFYWLILTCFTPALPTPLLSPSGNSIKCEITVSTFSTSWKTLV